MRESREIEREQTRSRLPARGITGTGFARHQNRARWVWGRDSAYSTSKALRREYKNAITERRNMSLRILLLRSANSVSGNSVQQAKAYDVVLKSVARRPFSA